MVGNIDTKTLVGWILTGVLVFLYAASPYLSKLLFSVFMNVLDNRIPDYLKKRVRKQLELPVSLLISFAFLYLAVFVALPWETYSVDFAVLDTIRAVLRTIFNIVLFFMVVFVTQRIMYTIYIALVALADFYHIGENTLAVMKEVFGIISVLTILGVTLITMVEIFQDSEPEDKSVTRTIVALVTGLNFLTASFVIAAAPVFRDIIAGLTVFFEGHIHSGDRIEIPGVMNEIGKVSLFTLRNTLVRFRDKSVVTIPNRYFLTYPTINYSNPTTSFMQISMSLLEVFQQGKDGAQQAEKETAVNPLKDKKQLRALLKTLETSVRRQLAGKVREEVKIDVTEAIPIGAKSQPEDDVFKGEEENVGANLSVHKAGAKKHDENELSDVSVFVDDNLTLFIRLKYRLPERHVMISNYTLRSQLVCLVTEELQLFQASPPPSAAQQDKPKEGIGLL